MQVVINISETLKDIADKDDIKTFSHFMWQSILIDAIKNSTPLPKGHGRLKDFDKIEWYGCINDFDCPFRHLDCKDCERAECDKTQVDEIPTIVEADRSEEDG
jgi:hypothetical protein